MALNENESNQFATLLRKVSFPLPQETFTAWCENFTTVAVELAVVRCTQASPEVFFTYREDFRGIHIPGSVLRPHERMADVLKRVIEEEIRMEVGETHFIAWAERPYGQGPGMSPRGDEIAFLFMAECVGAGREAQGEMFYPLAEIPQDLMSVHDPFFALLQKACGIA